MTESILVVDDSPTLRASLQFALGSAGYKVIEAKDGKDALTTLLNLEGEGKSLSMIITDINMPEMDGINFIKEVKKTAFKFTPIIVLTTESQQAKKMEGKIAGATGWLVKPFGSDQLIEVVQRILG
jgi:two-component system chemotaxis response regulator CheY